MLDLRKLEVFIKVYETRSFSKASSLLYLAQPTVTLHVKDLEQELGVNLLDRNTRKVIPTKAGKIVYKYGKEIISILKHMEKELEILKSEKSGVITIGASTIPGQYILPRAIKLFKEKRPEVSIFLKMGDSKEIVEKVFNREIEFGIVGAIFPTKELVFIPCFEDEIVLIGPKDTNILEIRLEDLYHLPILKREEGSGTWKNVVHNLEKVGINLRDLNIIGEMGSTEAIKEAVKSGLGFGFVSNLAIWLEKGLNLVKVIKIRDFYIKRKFYLIYPKGIQLFPVEAEFLEFIRTFNVKDLVKEPMIP